MTRVKLEALLPKMAILTSKSLALYALDSFDPKLTPGSNSRGEWKGVHQLVEGEELFCSLQVFKTVREITTKSEWPPNDFWTFGCCVQVICSLKHNKFFVWMSKKMERRTSSWISLTENGQSSFIQFITSFSKPLLWPHFTAFDESAEVIIEMRQKMAEFFPNET